MAEIQHLGEDSKGTVEQQHVKDSEIPRYGKDFKGKSKQPVKSQELTDEQLRELSGVIGADWEPVAASLGFNEARISKFKEDSPHHLEDLVFNMLVEWKQRNPPSLCQIEKLSRQLNEFGGNDITQLLRGILTHGEASKGRGKQQPAEVSELTDQRLRHLARKVGRLRRWEPLARLLGFDEAQIFNFKEESPHRDQIFNMLVEWTQRNPPSLCQIQTLSKQLNEVGRSDLALMLKVLRIKEVLTREPTGTVKSEPFSGGEMIVTVPNRPDDDSELVQPPPSDDDSELVQPPPSKRRRITGQFQPDSSGDTKEGNGTSSQPNLLKTLLEEFREMTAGFTEAELLRRTFKLPYITIAYINERGRSLTLEKYKVHLYIPRDALAKGPPQMVYVFVDPSAPSVDGVNPPYVALSPIIECGPTGLKFLNSVVLSFPHHANDKWELSTRMCHSDETTPKTWQALDAVRDGAMVLSRDNKVVLLLKHFTRFVAGGEPCEESAKLVKTGAFGSLYDPSIANYAIRIHVWNNDPVAKEKVIDMEKDMGSKPLDVYRDLQVFYNQGDVNAKIDNIKTGWEIEEKTPKEQKMLKAAVWQFPSNSVTFDLTRETNVGATASVSTQLNTSTPGCDSFVYQLKADTADSKWDWEGQEVRLSVRPKGGKCSLPTEIPERPVEDTCRICYQEQLKSAFTWNDDTERDGGLGGLSKETVKKLLRFLEDKSDGRCNWIHLAKELFGQETRLIDTLPQGEPTPANEILKLYFSFKREAGVRDHDAVGDLLEVFKRLGMNEAIQIVRAELTRQALRCTASETYTRCLSLDGIPMDHPPHNCRTLSEVADERLFRQLAKQIGREWKELATNLGFTSQGIYHIETDNVNNVGEQIFTMLASWRKECVINGTEWTRILPEKLKEIELPLLADFVIAHASPPEVENSANEEQAQQVG